jgi:hypothetical protein
LRYLQDGDGEDDDHEHDQGAKGGHHDHGHKPDAVGQRAAAAKAGRQHGQLEHDREGSPGGHGRRSGTVTAARSRQWELGLVELAAEPMELYQQAVGGHDRRTAAAESTPLWPLSWPMTGPPPWRHCSGQHLHLSALRPRGSRSPGP